MSIFSKLRREQSDEQRGGETAARARQAARRQAARVKRQAAEQAAAARERGGQAARDAVRAAREVEPRESTGVETPESTQEIFQRAGDSAQLRSPVEGSIDPGFNGPGMESFARADPTGPGLGGPSETADDEAADDGLLADGFVAGGSEADDSEPLDFDDSFVFGDDDTDGDGEIEGWF